MTDFANDLKRMLDDWNRATPAMRAKALAFARSLADAAFPNDLNFSTNSSHGWIEWKRPAAVRTA